VIAVGALDGRRVVVHVLGLPPEVCVVEYALTSTAQQR
jgi:hypothetical protein